MLLRIASLSAALALAGCEPSDAQEADEARADAARDLPCLAASLDVDQVGGDTFLVTGCQAAATYLCGQAAAFSKSAECWRTTLTEAWSTVTVNGVPFVPTGSGLCQSGDGEGMAFNGVDLHDAAGDTLRVVETPGLAFESLAIMADGTSSPSLEGCTDGHLYPNANGAGLSGNATIDCASGPWTIRGTVTFYGC
jgi:hypothetical protein